MSNKPILFADCVSAESTLIKVISNTSRNMHLYASIIDPALFNSEPCVAAFSRFARSSKVAKLQVLIEDHKLFAIRNPAFLDLAQRLTGRIEIRSVPAEIRVDSACYLLGDEQSIWYIPDSGVLSGTYNESNRVRAQKLAEQFLYLWERSKQPQDFRRLN